MGGVKVRIADLNDPRVATLIEAHATFARAQTGRGSAHALDLADLRTPGTAVWAARLRGAPLSVAALRRLSHGHGKVKSRHTTEAARRSGVGRALLGQLISVACGEGLARLSLETGSWPYFEPARAFYASCCRMRAFRRLRVGSQQRVHDGGVAVTSSPLAADACIGPRPAYHCQSNAGFKRHR